MPTARCQPLTTSRFTWAAALIVLVAAALRFAMLPEVPPGLHFDEAANALIAGDIAYRGYRPLFITSYTGKEVLWFYPAALLMRATGPEGIGGVFALRLNAAFFGVLTVAATGFVVRRLYARDARRDWLALLAMAILATGFWHLVLSRLAFRAISQPLMQALSLGLLWHGLRLEGRRRLAWLALAGAVTGLAGYTYLAVRLFPLALAVALLAWLVAERRRLRAHLGGLAVYGAAALTACAPLGAYFLRHPERFGTRIGQVAPQSWAEIAQGWQAALRMLFVSGDPLARFNLPGKPLFDPVLGALLVLGFAVALWETSRARNSLERARGALLIVWPFAMLAPTAFATNVPYPSNLRAVGLAPLIALYPALAIMALANGLAAQQGRLPAVGRALAPGALVLVVALGGGQALESLRRWGQMPALYYENHGDVAALGRFIDAVRQPDDTAYMATPYHAHPTLSYFSRAYRLEGSLGGGDTLALAPQGSTLMAYTRDALPPIEWDAWLAPYWLPAPPGPDGQPDFFVYRLPEGLDFPVSAVEPVDFGNVVRLEGARLAPAVSGGEAAVDLAWRVLGAPAAPDYHFVAEACDAWGECWPGTGADGQPERGINKALPSDRWQPGQRLLVHLRVPLPPGLPPGEYALRVRVVSDLAPALPVLSETGAFAGLSTQVGPLPITPDTAPALAALAIPHRLDVPAAPGITLLGSDLASAEARPGERLGLTLYWLAEAALADDLPVTLALAGGPILYQGGPVRGSYPFSAWQAGELVADRYTDRLPQDVAPGDYALTVRLGEHAPITLGEITVVETARRFELPPGIDAPSPPPVLGGLVTLAGFDVPSGPHAPGGALPVTLAWQAETAAGTGYTVFVHLVYRDGLIVAQVDRPPQLNGAPYPTDLWLPGEVVADTYELAIPPDASPGTYALRVGLYSQENGQRLAIPGTPDDAYTLPVMVEVGQ